MYDTSDTLKLMYNVDQLLHNSNLLQERQERYVHKPFSGQVSKFVYLSVLHYSITVVPSSSVSVLDNINLLLVIAVQQEYSLKSCKCTHFT